jgi:hypothetical protein
MNVLLKTMDGKDLIKKLVDLADKNADTLYEQTIDVLKEHPVLTVELKEAKRKLELAKLRELMDDFQIKLAYRLTVRNLIKKLQADKKK